MLTVQSSGVENLHGDGLDGATRFVHGGARRHGVVASGGGGGVDADVLVTVGRHIDPAEFADEIAALPGVEAAVPLLEALARGQER